MSVKLVHPSDPRLGEQQLRAAAARGAKRRARLTVSDYAEEELFKAGCGPIGATAPGSPFVRVDAEMLATVLRSLKADAEDGSAIEWDRPLIDLLAAAEAALEDR